MMRYNWKHEIFIEIKWNVTVKILVIDENQA